MNRPKNPLVIFGASGGATKVAQTLVNIGVDFLFFVDNDSKKWGSQLEGKEIKPPSCLKDTEYSIIIASDYYSEIEEQLIAMGIKPINIVLKEEFVIDFINDFKKEFLYIKEHFSQDSEVKHQSKQDFYLIDLAEGMGIGGIESWSFHLAELLLDRKKEVLILSKKTNIKPPDNLINQVQMFNMEYSSYKESIKDIIEAMKNYMPFTILANWMTQNYMAAYILKQMFPDKVTIIGVVHHDMVGYYKRNRFLQDKLDAFLCVSCDTKRQMTEVYGIEDKKVFYKEVPISYDHTYVKDCPDKNKPLQINFGARLVKSKKRVDLLLPLIEKLEANQVFYHFNIAGEGPYYEVIKEYAVQHELEDKITLYGGLRYAEMKEFWKKGDVVVSTSDSEGMGLSILEAMSYGAVPVVTNTAGIWDFVYQEVNGFVCDINDMETMAKFIKSLDHNRDTLKIFSKKAREVIKEKCRADSYIDFIDQLTEQ